MFLSTDEGRSWNEVGDYFPAYPDVAAFAFSGANLYAGTTGGGVFLSTDNGKSWAQINNGLTDEQVVALNGSGTKLFAGTTGGGVFLSTDNGTTWNQSNVGLTNTTPNALAALGTALFAGTDGSGVFISTDNGNSWTSTADNGLTNAIVNGLAVDGSDLYAGTWQGGIFLSTNSGASWVAVDSGLTDWQIQALAVFGSNIVASGMGGVFISSDSGAYWTPINSGLTSSIGCLAVSDTILFAGAGGVFLSTNDGASWTATADSGMPESPNNFVKSLTVSGLNLFAGLWGGGVFVSTDDGANWTPVDSGLTTDSITALTVSGGNLFAGIKDGGIWRRPLSEMITGVKQHGDAAPLKFSLSQNYPNPFNPTTVIDYQLPVNSVVTLKIYDILGREVATLINGRQSAGYYNAKFNGANLPSGVYLYRLQAGSFVQTKKLMLMK